MTDPAAKTSALGDRNSLLAALEAARAELDGVRRWFAFAVAASGGISIPDKALMLDAPAIERTYDPVTFTTTFRALLATTPPTAVPVFDVGMLAATYDSYPWPTLPHGKSRSHDLAEYVVAEYARLAASSAPRKD